MSKHINVRARAVAEYRSSFRALSVLVRELELRDLNAALGRFVAASNALALTRPEQTGAKYTVQRDLTEPTILCAACGLPFPAKHPQLPGPQSPFCSKTCSRRVAKRRERALAKAALQVSA